MKIISESNDMNNKRKQKLIAIRDVGEGTAILDQMVRKGASEDVESEWRPEYAE